MAGNSNSNFDSYGGKFKFKLEFKQFRREIQTQIQNNYGGKFKFIIALQAVAQSEIVECKDGLKFRSKDDPTSWPLTLDQPDPVLSPNPEAEIDNAGDSTSGTGSTSVSAAPVPAKTLTEKLSNPKATLTTSLNPNVPEFVPMASKVLTF